MFKIGDKVRIVKPRGDVFGRTNQEVGNIIDRHADNDWKIRFPTPDEDGDSDIYQPESSLELINGKRGRPSTKPRPVKFLLKYDLDEDHIEEFETMEQVTDRIDYLVKNESSLKRDSMIVYEIKSKKVVSVETKIKMK